MKNRKGVNLIAAIIIVVALVFLSITFSTLISSQSILGVKNFHSLKAFYIASSGAAFYIKELIPDDDWSSPPPPPSRSFSGGTFSLTTTDQSPHQISLLSTGVVTVGATTYTRKIKVGVKRIRGLGGIAAEYVVYWGGWHGSYDNETDVQVNVSVTGDILTDSDIRMGNNTTVNGDVSASGDIYGDLSGITGSIEANIELPAEIPTLESDYYEDQISIAQTYPSGNQTYSGTVDLSGTTYVNGNVEIQENAKVNITGTATIVAFGNVTVYNYADIGDNLTVIAGDDIILKSEIVVGRGGLWYSTAEIWAENNCTIGDPGENEGTVFISPTEIKLGNNNIFDGLLYGADLLTLGNNTDFSGLILSGYPKTIGQNSNLDRNPSALEWNSIPGIVYKGEEEEEGIEIFHWEEIY